MIPYWKIELLEAKSRKNDHLQKFRFLEHKKKINKNCQDNFEPAKRKPFQKVS